MSIPENMNAALSEKKTSRSYSRRNTRSPPAGRDSFPSVESIEPCQDDCWQYREATRSTLVRRESIPWLIINNETDEGSETDNFNPDEIRYTCKYDNQGLIVLHSLNFTYHQPGPHDLPSNPDETRVWWKSSSPPPPGEDHGNPPKSSAPLLTSTSQSEPSLLFAETIEEQVLRSLHNLKSRPGGGRRGILRRGSWSESDVISTQDPKGDRPPSCADLNCYGQERGRSLKALCVHACEA
jgi:hypothetical protein